MLIGCQQAKQSRAMLKSLLTSMNLCPYSMLLVTPLLYEYYLYNFLFVLLLSHLWFIYLFYLHLFHQPYISFCQATCVKSHQTQPTSAVAIATCEVQMSAADYHAVPTVATGVSKLCCRLTETFTLTSENLSLYITLLFLLVAIQLCSPRCWHLDSNYCRTRCRQSQLRFVLSPLLLHLRLLIVPVGYSTFHIDLAS